MSKAENLCAFLKTLKKERMYIDCWVAIDILCKNLNNLSDKQIDEILDEDNRNA